ncbi:hypothetical protein HP550_20005 [Cellulomonas humilata]|uniref:Uncharacterized protein n=1 Tax=Cellulomonas humilata TaxID=144055 RepID=A0A7Y6DZV1_9CELL|nr:hypothetical protein [Cellulomonas humilata]NUU19537.1 hypothetical protein [Cellulomonas humilata]
MPENALPRPALRWSLRALPLVAFVTVGLLTRSTPAALLAVAVGWIAAAILTAVWSATTATSTPRAAQTTVTPVPAVAPNVIATAGPEAPAATVPLVVPAAASQLGGSTSEPPAGALERAEQAARAHSGFLAGPYALVDGELLPTVMPPREGDPIVVRIDAGRAQERDTFERGQWTRTLAPAEVTATYAYEARARHSGGALLALRSYRDGRIYAEWHQVQDGEPNPFGSIPDEFTWEKNDNYYRGWVEPGDLSDLRDDRSIDG